MYKLTVTKYVENPTFEDEMQEYKNRNKYGYNNFPIPQKHTEQKHLEVVLEDEEYNVIKKEVIKVS